jgi:hypothetical protein
VNLCYFVSSFFQFVCLLLSFVHSTNWIHLCLLLFTIRNIIPFYDLEQRRKNIGEFEWNSMIVVQTISTTLNILLITNILDRGYVPIMILLIIFWHVGLQFALAG